MGGRANNKGKGKGGEKQESKYVKKVDLYKFLGKWLLRSYPDGHGKPLMLGQKTAAQALAPEALRGILDAECCELLRRPTMGINLSAASVDGASLLLPILQEKLAELAPKLQEDGFVEKFQFMNLAREVERDPADAPEMCKRYLKQVKRLVRDHGETLASAAEAAAGVYLGLISLLETAAVGSDLRSWAKSVPERKKQSKHLQAWLQDPASEEKFLAAIARNVKEDLKDDTRRRRFGDMEAVAAQDSSSSPVVGSTPPESSSEDAVARRKSSKKDKAKKSKKSKDQKKKKASKRKAEASGSAVSGTAAASEPSSQDSEPAGEKKRKASAAGNGSKATKKQKKEKEQSSVSDQETDAGAVAAAGESLLKFWPLSELQAFEEKAAQQATAAGAAGLAVDGRLALAKELPAEIQKLVWQRAGLLPTTQEDAVLRANADRLLQHTVEMVKEVRLAWVQAAIHEDQQKQKNITLLSEEDFFKKIRLTALPEEDQAAWNAALKGDSADCRRARSKLLKQGWTLEAVVENYNFALDFGTTYAKKEPKKEVILQLLQQIPSPLREAWGLPEEKKFQKQKPANWKTYCSVAYTLCWQIFKAHVDESVDE